MSLIQSPATLKRARRLRRNMTEPERLFWFLVRDRRFHGYKFRRQAPLGPYVVDFACYEAKLAIELDGEGHKSGEQAAFDAERTRVLASAGFRVLRFWNGWLYTEREAVIETLLIALEQRSGTNGPLTRLAPAARSTLSHGGRGCETDKQVGRRGV